MSPTQSTGPPDGSIGDQGSPSLSTSEPGSRVLARVREGRMCKLSARKATQFYGGTSLFQMPLTDQSVPVRGQHPVSPISTREMGMADPAAVDSAPFNFHPKDEVCRQLMATFFQNVYQYNMHIYREYFLRDYAASGGPYYSDALMFSICAVGALISTDPELNKLSPLFAQHAGTIVFNSLHLPDLTTLQSLITLGHLEIGQGRSSKGWLFCGMAFRLTHEMGLHLDPTNWPSNHSESSIDREILRRVYWAVFLVDKQLSLYFGRPPALYPQEADVRNTIRIPYPPEWESLLDKYISRGTSATAFEDGIRLVGSWVHQIELAKIFHTLIVDVFENRRGRGDAAAAAATVAQVHANLMRWHASLPLSLVWTSWTVGQVPPYVLNLHMRFHTCMIILHRPPRQHLDDEAVAKCEEVEMCYQSLSAILQLMKCYGRYYRFELLPLTFVQTLSAAAEVVMLKRYLEKSSWEDKDISKPMSQILEAMECVRSVYPCIREIQESIMASRQARGDEGHTETQGSSELALMDFLQSGASPFPSWFSHDDESADSVELGFLVTDDYLNDLQSWDHGFDSSSSRQ